MAQTEQSCEASGGQVAFSGLLYQIVGTLGLQAWALCRDEETPGEMDGLLDFVKDGALYHEVDDNDALIRRIRALDVGSHVVLQFKSSLQPQDHDLTPGDLAEILDRFAEGCADEHNVWRSERLASAYYVVTNRRSSRNLKRVLARSVEQQAFAQLESPASRRWNKQKAQRTPRHLQVLDTILQRTVILDGYALESFEQRLRTFAARYGVLGCDEGPHGDETEFERGVKTLIAELDVGAARQRERRIDEHYLAERICGYKHPRPLRALAVVERTAPERERFNGLLGINGPAIPRNGLLRQALDAASRHAFLLLKGNGGNGKSVLGWQVAQAICAGKLDGAPCPGIVLSAQEVSPLFPILSWLVGEWANRPTTLRSEAPETSLARLRLANPQQHLVVCLCLDGLDEAHLLQHAKEQVRALVTWFWRQEELLRQAQAQSPTLLTPEATLVVSCRNERDVIRSWLGGTLSQAIQQTPPEYIPVDEFSDDDVLEAMRLVWPEQASRFESTPRSPVDRSDLGGDTHRPARLSWEHQPVHPDIAAALHHPVLWYAFRLIPPEQVDAFLDGQPAALHAVALRIVDWFTDKVEKRHGFGSGLVENVLKRIAGQVAQLGGVDYPAALWKTQSAYEGMAAYPGEIVFQEALSAGLIEDVEPHRLWKWRHQFVAGYLQERAQSEGMVAYA